MPLEFQHQTWIENHSRKNQEPLDCSWRTWRAAAVYYISATKKAPQDIYHPLMLLAFENSKIEIGKVSDHQAICTFRLVWSEVVAAVITMRMMRIPAGVEVVFSGGPNLGLEAGDPVIAPDVRGWETVGRLRLRFRPRAAGYEAWGGRRMRPFVLLTNSARV